MEAYWIGWTVEIEPHLLLLKLFENNYVRTYNQVKTATNHNTRNVHELKSKKRLHCFERTFSMACFINRNNSDFNTATYSIIATH